MVRRLRFLRGRRAQFGEACLGVVGVRFGDDDAREELASGHRVAGAVEDVAKRVPEPDVTERRIAQLLGPAGLHQQFDRLGVLLLIGKRRRHDDAALDQDLGRGLARSSSSNVFSTAR